MKKSSQFVIILLLVFLTGCALGRRTIELPIPKFPDKATERGEISIATIEDNRVFRNEPADPSIPSIDGDVNSLTPKEKALMIGRQRSGYGMALGDIALPADDSVVDRTRRLLEEGFNGRGYSITSDPSAPNSANVTIDEFWAWFTPGFWTISFEARVYCTIKLTKSDGSSTIVVKGYGINKGQVGRDANWQLAYERAFRDFLSKLDSKLDEAGF